MGLRIFKCASCPFCALAISAVLSSSIAFGGSTLYATDGFRSNPDTRLYILSPVTGEVLEDIGPIGFAITAMAFHPETGVLYGTTDCGALVARYSLIRIDINTGAGTFIGAHVVEQCMAGIAFDASGVLYGWGETRVDSLYTIDLTTGAGTRFGTGNAVTSGSGMAFDSSGTLWHSGATQNGVMATVDMESGRLLRAMILDRALLVDGLAFDGEDRLFGSERFTGNLLEFDLANAVVNTIGFSLFNFDALAFLVLPDNLPPSSNAGGPYFVECDGPNTMAVLDGSLSDDPDGDALTYLWETDCPGAVFDDPTSPTPLMTFDATDFALNSCTVELTVSDGMFSDTSAAFVFVEDTTPPDISATVTPDTLWPPNGKLVEVVPTFIVGDDCDGAPGPSVSLVSITSNQDFGPHGDVVVEADGRIFLRAKRHGHSGARVYTLTFEGVDSSGNTTTTTALVTVPHDLRDDEDRESLGIGGKHKGQDHSLRHYTHEKKAKKHGDHDDKRHKGHHDK